jgi:hypothetical protein
VIAPAGAVVLPVAMTAETKELIARKRRMLSETVIKIMLSITGAAK